MIRSQTFAKAMLLLPAALLVAQLCLAEEQNHAPLAPADVLPKSLGMVARRSAGVTVSLPPDADDLQPVGAPLPHYLFRLTPERHAAMPKKEDEDIRPEDGGFVAALDPATHAER